MLIQKSMGMVPPSFFSFFFKSRPPYQVEKKKEMGVQEVGVSEEGVCYKIVFL